MMPGLSGAGHDGASGALREINSLIAAGGASVWHGD
jgi:hypothetical protein